MRTIIATICALLSLPLVAQTVSLNPTITPSLFRYNDQITVTYDVTGTSLTSLTNAWIWVWIPGKNTDARYNINPASNNPTLTNNAKFTKNGNVYSLTFRPSDFFTGSISSETKLGMLLKGNDWPNGQTTDFIANIWDGSFQVSLVSPSIQPLFVTTGTNINVRAETPIASDFQLLVNNVPVDAQTGLTVYTYTLNVAEVSGGSTVKIVATAGASSAFVTFQYLISAPSPVQARPAGSIAGINYGADPTKVTLCLWAPGKTSVYVQGDFSNWDVLPANLMKRDGELFWIELTGLTSGLEYGYRYLVNESLYVADPYSDKILDPDDSGIPAGSYPSLKAFPSKAVSDKWYFNRVSVFQTNQAPYTWQVNNFVRPSPDKLTIYELHIRDFFGPDSRNYQRLIDTLTYFKRLGVNAIELMPVTEFNGNDSWGYNPTFMFAPDKYYGTKNKFKEFIDKCHQNGIAVILDIVMNHQDIPNTYAMLDFDFNNYKPTANNKWFNVDATHPFNVFYDMNHESTYTKKYLDTVNYYWMHEFRVDGYRFDLSKGFTQTNNPGNVGAWSAYDASRIAILKRMADKIWSHTPDGYVMLEHLSDNTEEKELAEYRAGEGKGMMLWANLNYAYNQCTMGFGSGSDISGVYHGNRGWTAARSVGYMESHDEERLMYKNIQFGNNFGAYNVKSVDVGLQRNKAASLLFYTIPGPKMLWQFGELGYDYSINTCPDGTVNSNCRISAKPVKWDYQKDVLRRSLYDVTADLIRLRNTYSVFSAGTPTFGGGNSLYKQIMLKNNPYTASPVNASQMNAVAVANFDVVTQTGAVTFPHTGTWFEYYSATTLTVSGATVSLELLPGHFRLYTDVQIQNQIKTAVEDKVNENVAVYPNPVHDVLRIKSDRPIDEISLISLLGIKHAPGRINEDSWNVDVFAPGLYVVEIYSGDRVFRRKVIRN